MERIEIQRMEQRELSSALEWPSRDRRRLCQRLFKQHYAKMYRMARTILYDEQESEDVVSDIFEVLTSVRNRCLKRLRRPASAIEGSGYNEPVDASDVEDERLTDIDEFIACHLSEQEQRIFRLRFTDGCSYEEIAAAEGISRVAVWKHLSRALNLIRNHFNK